MLTIRETRALPVGEITGGLRFFEPTEDAIQAMAASLEENGQLTPIAVHRTKFAYALIFGQTRLDAARRLGWPTIRAEIVEGDALAYRIAEITENLHRKTLTAEQRKAAKAELKKLLREKIAAIASSKGGRGKTGGLRQAARELGLPESTARSKLRENPESRAVSVHATKLESQDAGRAYRHDTVGAKIEPEQDPKTVRITRDPVGELRPELPRVTSADFELAHWRMLLTEHVERLEHEPELKPLLKPVREFLERKIAKLTAPDVPKLRVV